MTPGSFMMVMPDLVVFSSAGREGSFTGPLAAGLVIDVCPGEIHVLGHGNLPLGTNQARDGGARLCYELISL
jgi:hypothetical protein